LPEKVKSLWDLDPLYTNHGSNSFTIIVFADASGDDKDQIPNQQSSADWSYGVNSTTIYDFIQQYFILQHCQRLHPPSYGGNYHDDTHHDSDIFFYYYYTATYFAIVDHTTNTSFDTLPSITRNTIKYTDIPLQPRSFIIDDHFTSVSNIVVNRRSICRRRKWSRSRNDRSCSVSSNNNLLWLTLPTTATTASPSSSSLYTCDPDHAHCNADVVYPTFNPSLSRSSDLTSTGRSFRQPK
jgi:hypothetical protein